MYRLKVYSKKGAVIHVFVVFSLTQVQLKMSYCIDLYGHDIYFTCEMVY